MPPGVIVNDSRSNSNDDIQIALAPHIQTYLSQTGRRHSCCSVMLPVAFERAAAKSWFDPKYDSPVLEEQFQASVYPHIRMRYSAQESELNEVIIKTNTSGVPAFDQEKIDQYIKAMSLTGSEKENTEKLAAMWMYATQMRSLPPTPRKMQLIPAPAGGSSIISAPPLTPAMIMSPGTPIPPMPYRGIATLPYMRPPPPTAGPLIYAPYPMAPPSMPGTFRTHRSSNMSTDVNNQRRRRRAAAASALVAANQGRMTGQSNRRPRRKSEADVVDGQAAFTYTGLDRAMADSFLVRQEQSNTGSHVDYSSSSSSAASDCGDGRKAISRASSKTKIVCRDVPM